MLNIAVTGAAGNVGQQAMDALDGHDLTPITHRDHDDLDGIVLDVTDRESLTEALEGQDVVIHLAANASPNASWESVDEVNINGTYNVYEAARANDVDRIVFASSHHIAHMHNTTDQARAGTTKESPSIVRPDSGSRPDSYYAVSKITGEGLGSFYADRYGIDVVNLRIGWLLSEDELREKQDNSPARARHARANWLSPRDCRNALQKAVENDLSKSPVTINVISQNDDRYLTLTESLQSLGYQPRDNAATVLERSKS